jgi:hypothetical protein
MVDVVLEAVVVEKLTQPLYFSSLEEADEFEVLAHEDFLVAGQFGDHGPAWVGVYFLIS